MSDIQKVLIVGAGEMGYSLAVLHARAAREVWLTDRDPAMLERALPRIEDALATLEKMGALPESPASVRARIKPVTSLPDALPGADLLVEAISENAAAKQAFYQLLADGDGSGRPIDPQTLVASNTSGLDIFALAPESLLPQLYAAHHFVPAHVVPAVEVVQPANPRPEWTQRLLRHYRKTGAIPVLLKRFCRGFLVTRLQFALSREIFALMQEDIADPVDLDLLVKASLGVRLPVLGVVKRMDFAGLGMILNNLRNYDPTASPPVPLERLVAEGKLGIAAGMGFYDYGNRSVNEICRERDEKMLQVLRLLQTLQELDV
jgi:3-hydroxyacyl-CoA dehydrogenase